MPQRSARPHVFINYRREDSSGYAGRLRADLAEAFGKGNIFMDIDTIPPGADFGRVVEDRISSSDVVLALIGKHWLSATDTDGRRRLDKPEDWVRLELESALNRADVRVIPTLVGGADPPSSDDLPAGLEALARRHAFELSDARWPHDVEHLVHELGGATTVDEPRSRKRAPGRVVLVGIAIVLLLAAAAAVGIFALGGDGSPTPPPGQTNKQALKTYVAEIDSMLTHSADTKGNLGGLIADVNNKAIGRDDALAEINQIIGERRSLLNSLPPRPPQAFVGPRDPGRLGLRLDQRRRRGSSVDRGRVQRIPERRRIEPADQRPQQDRLRLEGSVPPEVQQSPQAAPPGSANLGRLLSRRPSTAPTAELRGLGQTGVIGDGSVEFGTIPFRLRIGVTGHRTLHDEEHLTTRLREALDRIRALLGPTRATHVVFTVVSPLAEGADRLVAREVLRTQDARLEAVIPFPRDEYLLDFEEAASRADFEDLLADADRVDEQPGGPSPDPDEAYARVGQAVVDRSDILIAIWDGRPARGHGGTAEIVDYARRQGRPVVLIPPEAGELKLEPGHGPPSQMVARLDQFNRESIQRSTTAKLLQEARSAFCGPKQTAALGHTEAEALSEWIAPYFARADYLANRYRFWFYRLTDLLYLAASAAVAVVAVQSFFFHEHFWIVWSEVVLLVVLLGVVVYGRRVRLQRRWLSNRFLAERLRSAFYLAAIGTAERGESTFAGADTADEWIQGALLEVWNRRPTVTRKQPEPLRGPPRGCLDRRAGRLLRHRRSQPRAPASPRRPNRVRPLCRDHRCGNRAQSGCR